MINNIKIKSDFEIVKKNGVTYLRIPLFENAGDVRAVVSTRLGSIEKDSKSEMNLNVFTCRNGINGYDNFKIFCDAADLPLNAIVANWQTHSIKVMHVDENDRKRGYFNEENAHKADGLITDKTKVLLFTYYADCVPLYFYDPLNKIIGLAHAGWRGTANGMVSSMVKEMSEHYNSNPKDLLGAVGPSIGPCCYEVDEPVVKAFSQNPAYDDNWVEDLQNGKYIVDLWQSNFDQMLKAGIKSNNIAMSGMCTKCHEDDLFHSYRRQKGKNGNIGAFLMLL